VGRAREAVKQGRKDKLGLVMITQNPGDIDDDILKQTNTNVFLHLREEVIEDVPSLPRGYKRDIPIPRRDSQLSKCRTSRLSKWLVFHIA
jgi:DNA helicase HerA-like ATPase